MSVYVEQKLSRACVVLVVFDMLTLNKTWLISLKTWQTCFIWKRSHIFCLFTIIKLTTWKGRSWPWLYGSLIYNYLYAISAYHHWCCAFESRSGRGVQHYMIKVCQWHATGQWFSPGPPVSSTNKTDCHDITEILFKVTLNTIKQTKNKHKHRCYIY